MKRRHVFQAIRQIDAGKDGHLFRSAEEQGPVCGPRQALAVASLFLQSPKKHWVFLPRMLRLWGRPQTKAPPRQDWGSLKLWKSASFVITDKITPVLPTTFPGIAESFDKFFYVIFFFCFNNSLYRVASCLSIYLLTSVRFFHWP